MQELCEYIPAVDMKRDMELVRNIMFAIEADPRFDGTKWLSPTNPGDFGISDHSMEELNYHLAMLIDEGFLIGKVPPLGMGKNIPVIAKLTWKGHEFLDDTRDPDIWDKTKERAKGLTSVGVAFIWEIAKAEIKTRLHLP